MRLALFFVSLFLPPARRKFRRATALCDPKVLHATDDRGLTNSGRSFLLTLNRAGVDAVTRQGLGDTFLSSPALCILYKSRGFFSSWLWVCHGKRGSDGAFRVYGRPMHARLKRTFLKKRVLKRKNSLFS